jgi:hypothetical protein
VISAMNCLSWTCSSRYNTLIKRIGLTIRISCFTAWVTLRIHGLNQTVLARFSMFSGALLYSFASWLSPSGSMGSVCAHGGHVITYSRCSVWKLLDHPCSLDRLRHLESPGFILSRFYT